ncbi:MAG: cbb3-type cytochrome c oxidase subunit II [Oligoflexales bacterium]|nr:cbb3-type cytochrome c oxidase subunit II [Oligoflexales bacterium]
MRTTPLLLIFGSMMVFMASVFLMVIMPAIEMNDLKPSEIWRQMSSDEFEGSNLFVNNGCSYCHSQYIRSTDWDIGAERITEAGDFWSQNPAILGTERIGPDLAQEGGEHSDDWHLAHFMNPRFTRPESLMPNWAFLGEKKIRLLIAYVQSKGLKNADYRVKRQKKWHDEAVLSYSKGPDANIAWLHNNIPDGWRKLPNPYPDTEAALLRGKKMFQTFCIGCHGPIGDGMGEARPYINPPPLNFTTLRRHLEDGRYIGGILYYQIMNGITGTAMPYFKKDLESEKIWDLSNYIGVYFLGYTDANVDPKGIEASYEPYYPNQFEPPKFKFDLKMESP